MALGASPTDVLRLVMRQGAVLAVTGVGIGLVGAIAAVRGLQAVLYEISPWDPLAWIVSAGTLLGVALLGVALLASWIPARRAPRVDPVTALRA